MSTPEPPVSPEPISEPSSPLAMLKAASVLQLVLLIGMAAVIGAIYNSIVIGMRKLATDVHMTQDALSEQRSLFLAVPTSAPGPPTTPEPTGVTSNGTLPIKDGVVLREYFDVVNWE